MPPTDPTQCKVKLPNLASHGQQGLHLSVVGLLPRKRITFIGLTVLVLMTVFGFVYRSSPEYALEFVKFSANVSETHSSDTHFTPKILGNSRRPRGRRTPTVPTALRPTPILTLPPTTSTLHKFAQTSKIKSTPTTTTKTSTTTSATTSTTTSTTSITTSTTKITSTRVPSITTLRTTPLTSQKVTRRPVDVSRYVSFEGGFADGRGLGNQIFCFAAVLYVAELTGREPAIENFDYVIQLDKVFELNVERFDSLCPCHHMNEAKHLAFDEETDKKALNSQKTANKSILVSGFRQSWRYTLSIERRLRRHLVFKDELRKFGEEFLTKNIPPGWNRAGFLRVAIHIRRGDILEKRLINYGYTVPNATYFEKAMTYFTQRYGRIQFITLSQDEKWARENIRAGKNQTRVHVTHASGHSAGQDMAIMAMCDHMIMSTGTFGWWGGWLAKGTTVYYSDWPRNGSGLGEQFKREDFFPPNWIPMTD